MFREYENMDVTHFLKIFFDYAYFLFLCPYRFVRNDSTGEKCMGGRFQRREGVIQKVVFFIAFLFRYKAKLIILIYMHSGFVHF